MPYNQEKIWIIGASSGIGRSLSIALAKQGATLILSARREEELQKLNEELEGQHTILPLDAVNQLQMVQIIEHVFIVHETIDRVIFLPALYDPNPIADMDIDKMVNAVAINITAAMSITHALLPYFEKQKSGQIALCGSVAGYVGLPNGQPYSATKAAIINFAESLHAESPDYLDIKLINPGFVETPMTDKNEFDMPMIIKPEQAANYILKGLKKKAFEIHFPKRFTYLLKAIASLPYGLMLPIIKRFDKK